jgi:hypothetical protein
MHVIGFCERSRFTRLRFYQFSNTDKQRRERESFLEARTTSKRNRERASPSDSPKMSLGGFSLSLSLTWKLCLSLVPGRRVFGQATKL